LTKVDVETIIANLPFAPIRQAMSDRLDDAFKGQEALRLFSFALPGAEMTPDIYDYFRPTGWFIVSIPDRYFGEGMQRTTIRPKLFVQPSPSICYHATPKSNQESIKGSGILPGFKLNKTGHGKMFLDSPYYIYASLTEQDARDWCGRFTEEEFLIYPLQIGKAGIRLFVDSCSVDWNTGVTSGYIIDALHIPPHLLASPIPCLRD